jgi:REP element-mobilizing transposase RayT
MFIRHRQRNPASSNFGSEVWRAGRPPRKTHTHMNTATLLAKYRYRRRLPHLQKADADLFITFCTGGRKTLAEEARDLVMAHCLREGGILPFAGEGARATLAPRVHLYAVVVMPDHAHLLLNPLRDANGWPFPLVDILQCFKGATAHRINKLLHTSGPVWEEESFDHVLRSDEGLKNKCEYIRQNPVAAGLVERPEDYQWLWVDPELRF